MQYLINDVAVNSRTDWRHVPVPGPAQSRREEQFPGLAERSVVKGPTLPPDIVVTGFLEATGADIPGAIDTLSAIMLTENSRKAATVLYTVTVHTRVYEDCELMEFAPGNEFIRVADPAVVKLKIAATYRWRQLRNANL